MEPVVFISFERGYREPAGKVQGLSHNPHWPVYTTIYLFIVKLALGKLCSWAS